MLSFLTLPYFSVYSATKAFVLSFSQTIQAELESDKVIVTTLCPGPINTAWASDDMWTTNAYKLNRPHKPEFVASVAVKHLLTGNGTKVVGLYNWFLTYFARIAPIEIMLKFKAFLGSQHKYSIKGK